MELEDRWVHLRASGTEPVSVLREAPSQAEAEALATQVRDAALNSALGTKRAGYYKDRMMSNDDQLDFIDDSLSEKKPAPKKAAGFDLAGTDVNTEENTAAAPPPAAKKRKRARVMLIPL